MLCTIDEDTLYGTFSTISSSFQVTFPVQYFTRVRNNLVAATLSFQSLATTLLATAMIIYRLHHDPKSNVGGTGRYNFKIGILAESGAMYAATLLIACVLLVVHGIIFNVAPGDTSFWAGLITPVAVCTLTHRS